MSKTFAVSICLAAAIAQVFAGCSSGPGSQLSRCQEDKDKLLATIREQRDTNVALRDKLVSLETRLDQSEKELAQLHQPGQRLSSRPFEKPPIQKSQLPWRAPASEPGVPAKSTNSLTR